MDDQGTARRIGDDQVAKWSSQGTTQDGFAKPELTAPGSQIVSTIAPGSAYAKLCPECVVDGAYFRAGGTSMAAPVVSGVVALVLQAHPEWTPDQVKWALTHTLAAAQEPARRGQRRVRPRPADRGGSRAPTRASRRAR